MEKAVHLLNLYFPHRIDSSKPLWCKVSLRCWCPGSVQTRNQKGKAKKKAAKKEEGLMPPSKTYTTPQSKTMLNCLQIYNTCRWCRKSFIMNALWKVSFALLQLVPVPGKGKHSAVPQSCHNPFKQTTWCWTLLHSLCRKASKNFKQVFKQCK